MSSKIIGYIRISTDRQDLDKQRHLLLEHARRQHLFIDEFVEIEISSRKSNAARRIDELIAKLDTGDLLLVAELSRLGREMLQVLNIINALSEKGVEITFIRQPELSTSGDYGKLLLPSSRCVSNRAWRLHALKGSSWVAQRVVATENVSWMPIVMKF
jgi:DNA invertase Pin-like site-specific DNA recombinase